MLHFQAWKKKDFNQYNVVAFDPIKIYTHLAPQNDRLNLSFVKDIYVVAQKMARNDQKMAIRANGWRWFPIDDDICTTFLKISL